MEQFPWYYPSIGEYTALMEKVGFRVTFAHLCSAYTNNWWRWVKKLAEDVRQSLFENLDPEKQQRVIEKIEQQLKEKLFHNGQWVLITSGYELLDGKINGRNCVFQFYFIEIPVRSFSYLF